LKKKKKHCPKSLFAGEHSEHGVRWRTNKQQQKNIMILYYMYDIRIYYIVKD